MQENQNPQNSTNQSQTPYEENQQGSYPPPQGSYQNPYPQEPQQPPQGQYYSQPPYGQQYNPYGQPVNRGGTDGMAIVGLVLGIVGLVFCWIPYIGYITPILCIVGIVLSSIALKNRHSGIAIAGLVCSIIGLVVTSVVVIIVMWIAHTACSILSDANNIWSELQRYGTMFLPFFF